MAYLYQRSSILLNVPSQAVCLLNFGHFSPHTRPVFSRIQTGITGDGSEGTDQWTPTKVPKYLIAIANHSTFLVFSIHVILDIDIDEPIRTADNCATVNAQLDLLTMYRVLPK